MKQIFKDKLTFENFAQIFTFICSHAGLEQQNTDVDYRFGCIGGGSTDIPYGHFKLRAKCDAIDVLSQIAPVVQPFEKSEGITAADEYLVLVVATEAINGKAKFIFTRRGHMGALTNDRIVAEFPIAPEQKTVILIFPLNYRSASVGVGTKQERYYFDAPIYGKSGEIAFGYNHWYQRMDDRD